MQRNSAFHRQALLSGDAALEALSKTRVILFGVGGVGSWCAESLVRSGIGELAMVDSDLICTTNNNRQLHATSETVGCVKVEVMAERLRAINPEARITAIQEVFVYKTAETFDIESYDYTLDAIDRLSPKVDLIQTALPLETTLFSAQGASCKLDPTRIKVGSFWKVEGCPLAKKVRKRLRKRKVTGDFLCVYSDELLEPLEAGFDCKKAECLCPEVENDTPDAEVRERYSAEKQINGSAVHITAPFGFFLSSLVYRDVVTRLGLMPVERGRE
jgi:tRNA A37 threonylcarbamoyladenosine dehydratase